MCILRRITIVLQRLCRIEPLLTRWLRLSITITEAPCPRWITTDTLLTVSTGALLACGRLRTFARRLTGLGLRALYSTNPRGRSV